MIRTFVVLSTFLFVACGAQEDELVKFHQFKSDAITYSAYSGSAGTSLVAANPKGSWSVYAKNSSDVLSGTRKPGNVNLWSTMATFPSPFSGRPGIADIDIDGNWCDFFAFRQSNGQISFYAHQFFSGPEFGCLFNVSPPIAMVPVPGFSLPGNPAPVTWKNGTNYKAIIAGRSATGGLTGVIGDLTNITTAPYGWSATWSSWTDSSVTLLAGTDPVFVALEPGGAHLFICDSASRLQMKTYASGSWGAWVVVVGSGCTSTPSATGSYQVYKGVPRVSFTVVVNNGGTFQYVMRNLLSGIWDTTWTTLPGATFTGAPVVYMKEGGGRRVWGKPTSPGELLYGDF